MNLSKIGVIGAGTMGNGIAQVSAAAGLEVVMVDVSQAALDRGLAAIGGSLDRLVKKQKLSADVQAAVRSRIRGSTQYRDLAAADLVIEAATENPEVKRGIMRQADEIMRPEAILATNTSSISITALAAATTRADRVVGMHFFNPVKWLRLACSDARAGRASFATPDGYGVHLQGGCSRAVNNGAPQRPAFVQVMPNFCSVAARQFASKARAQSSGRAGPRAMQRQSLRCVQAAGC